MINVEGTHRTMALSGQVLKTTNFHLAGCQEVHYLAGHPEFAY
jgi:hypothetical protein